MSTPAPPLRTAPSFSAPGSRLALSGFFISGMLLAFLGAVLPSWGHHLTSAYPTIGLYFFSLAIGIVTSARLGQWLLPHYSIRVLLITGNAIGAGALLYLAAVCPPSPAWTRIIGLFFVGSCAGLLHTAILHAISPMYRHDPAATVNIGGTLFGLGCLTSALLISGSYFVYTVPSMLILLAVIPGFFAVICARARFGEVTPEARRPIRSVLDDLRSPSALFFAALLFFQFGNEWSIAGWLSLFLIQRLGISPEKALLLLAVYWLALLVGRIVAQSLLPRISHSRFLIGSVIAAVFGSLILSFTDNRFGAMMGILFIGGGFAPIYPLVVEKIGDRFPDYHPGFYNGIFSFAFFGGLLAPCSLGWAASLWDVRAVMVLPLFGTLMVLFLLVAIWVEGRFPLQSKAATGS